MAKPMPGKGKEGSWTDWSICLLLIACSIVVYAQTRHHGFISYDDPDYVTDNPHVRAGLSLRGLGWALTSTSDANWFPLTRLSHMIDCQFFGLGSGAHHMTSVALHIMAALLLFWVFRRMTGSRAPSAVVALLFALHPLNVESVAWIAERKNVLSTFFFFLTIWGYLRYVDAPRPGRYIFIVVAFCLGLMCKAMLVTVPFLLLLLDVWPLQRLRLRDAPQDSMRRKGGQSGCRTTADMLSLIREKTPLFIIAGGASIVTYVVQSQGGAVIPMQAIAPGERLANAVVSCVTYMAQAFRPTNLSVFYPYPTALPGWHVAAAGAILLSITGAAVCSFRTHTWFAVGWFWFLGSLVPVIGFVQVGLQSHADRYMYIPSIGIFVAVVWGIWQAVEQSPRARIGGAALAVAACFSCLLLSRHQVQYWSDSESLFRHALSVTDGNYVVHKMLGRELARQGKVPEAMAHFRNALSIQPRYSEALNEMGVVLLKQGRNEDALGYLSQAVQLSPQLPQARTNLGTIFLRMNRFSDAMEQFSTAIRLQPDSAEARCGLGLLYEAQGRADEALLQLNEAVELKPDYADARYNLGRVLAGVHRTDEAIAQFRSVLRISPDHVSARYNLGTALASRGELDEAVAEFAAAVRLKPDYAAAHNNLGSALASLGRYEEAIPYFREALRIDPTLDNARQNLEYALSLQTEATTRPR